MIKDTLINDILCHNTCAISAFDSYLKNLDDSKSNALAESIKECEFKNGVIFDLYVIHHAPEKHFETP